MQKLEKLPKEEYFIDDQNRFVIKIAFPCNINKFTYAQSYNGDIYLNIHYDKSIGIYRHHMDGILHGGLFEINQVDKNSLHISFSEENTDFYLEFFQENTYKTTCME